VGNVEAVRDAHLAPGAETCGPQTLAEPGCDRVDALRLDRRRGVLGASVNRSERSARDASFSAASTTSCAA